MWLCWQDIFLWIFQLERLLRPNSSGTLTLQYSYQVPNKLEYVGTSKNTLNFRKRFQTFALYIIIQSPGKFSFCMIGFCKYSCNCSNVISRALFYFSIIFLVSCFPQCLTGYPCELFVSLLVDDFVCTCLITQSGPFIFQPISSSALISSFVFVHELV